MHGEQVLGLLGRSALLRAMAQEGPDAYVASVMDREYWALNPDSELSDAMPMLAQSGNCMLVMQEGKLLGMITTENVTEFLLLKRMGLDSKA